MGSADAILSATDDTINDWLVDNQVEQLFMTLDYERDFGTDNTPQLRQPGCQMGYTMEVVSTP